MTDTEKLRKLMVESHRMLNKINRVTSRHRHGLEQIPGDLTQLSNRQLEFEETLRRVDERYEHKAN